MARSPAKRSRFSAFLAKDRRFVVRDPLGSSAAMRTHSGFTLIELLVALAVASILIAAATPSLSSFFRTNRLAATTNEMVLSLQLARAEAARRGRAVSLCASSDGATCAGGTAWAGGWIVFQDANATGTPAPGGSGAQLIRVFQASDGAVSLTGPAFARFNPDGSASAALGSESVFDVQVEDCVDAQRRRVRINRLGRVRTERAGCGAP
jgi:type IV fimbrial biogenesis protein FimT